MGQHLFNRRKVLTLISSLPFFAAAKVWAENKITWIGTPRLMQGPMVGWVAANQISIWVRASGPYKITVEYAEDWENSRHYFSEPVVAGKDDDYTVVLVVQGLKPSTPYFYQILVEDKAAPGSAYRGPLPVKTAPPVNQSQDFNVAFGSCCKIRSYPVQPVWQSVLGKKPDLFFWLGDNIYADSLDPDILAEEYRRQRSLPELQPLIHSVPQLAVWDDHDYGLNDQDKRNPIKEDALRIFKRYWANPGYGLADAEGVFFQYSYGAVDFFFLDDRYYRDPVAETDGPSKTMLGEKQKTWLKKGLKESRAIFKILIAGNGWTAAKGAGEESWASFLHERDEVFNFIRDKKISGVVLLSGDTHVAELNCIPRSDVGGYDLYELVSSPLANDTANSWINYLPIPRVRQVYANGVNFGMLHFDLQSKDPAIRLAVYDARGKAVWKPVVAKASELENGVSSWREKMDAVSLKRWQRYQQGGSYY